MVPPPVSPSAQGAHYAQQFLSNVLSQRGPDALPYPEDVKWLIRQHLVVLIENYPSLQAKTASFTHNNGRTVHLLQADGTIPMTYQDVTYNIPVVIWLMESYPRHPPCVYVAPTSDMIIKRGHPHVNPSGLVSAPYLHSWVFPSSNLIDLVRTLSLIFGRDPPLYTKQTRPNPTPTPSHSQSLPATPSSSTHSSGHPPPPRGYSSPYSGRFPPSPHRPPTADPAEVYSRNAINKLLETIHADIAALRKNRETEMEALFTTQAALRQRQEVLAKGLREMQDEKESLEQQLQIVLMNSDVLEGWVRENENKIARKVSLDIDEIFEPMDVLSKQMLDCTAADLAIEDVIYSLDKAVQEGSIPFEFYLKQIRAISRDQFFHRAMAAKVRAAQMQARVATMAAREPPYAL
ncbi:protein ELC-like [Aristolochia californica]|uniref:protein ELC-like n=1 Tax=Aristolochia californica TaxID=171875 RepID=UPI0035E38F99